MNRRLYRCRHDKRVAGVASGLAEYLELDVSIVRVLWVISIFFGGVGLLLYFAMAIIVPLEPAESFAMGAQAGDPTGETGNPTGQAPLPSPTGWHSTPATHRHATGGSGRGTTFVGIVLILFGAIALINVFLPDWADGGRFIWPAFILGIGALLVASAVRREPTPP